MILSYFKSKQKMKIDAFDAGYRKGAKLTERRLSKKQKRITDDYNKILLEKESKIDNLNNHVKDIEKNLEKYTLLFANLKCLALEIDEESEIKLRQTTEKYQEAKSLSREIIALTKRFNEKAPKTQNKIDNFKRETLQ